MQRTCSTPKTTTIAVGIAILALVTSTVIACENKGPPSRPSGGATSRAPAPAPQPQRKANLRIAKVEVFPEQPQAGTRFTANVYVENDGDMASGDYDLALHIKDVARRATYPIGTFRKSGLQPGERVVAFTKNDLMVNSAGAHQLWVDIKPFGFADANSRDNSRGWAFDVTH